MSRAVVGLDRAAALLLGLVLLAVGALAALWGGGWLPQLLPASPRALSTAAARDVVGAGWFPGAAGGAALVLVLLGLWWALAHVPRRGVGLLSLPGSRRGARLLVDPSAPAGTAAEVLAETRGVRSASGRVLRERGAVVVELSAVVDAGADLAEVVAATEEVAADLQQVLGRPDTTARVRLSVARTTRRTPRVS